MKETAVIVHMYDLENKNPDDPHKPFWKPNGGISFWMFTVQYDATKPYAEDQIRQAALNSTECREQEIRTNPMWIRMVRSIELMEPRDAHTLTIETEDNFDPIQQLASARYTVQMGV